MPHTSKECLFKIGISVTRKLAATSTFILDTDFKWVFLIIQSNLMGETTLRKEQKGFCQVANKVLNDANLSFKAKGIYAFIESKPDGWNFSGDRISKQTKDGRKSVYNGLKELEEKGYLVRAKNKSGKSEYWLFHSVNGLKPPVAQKGKEPKGQRAKRGSISNKEFIVIKKVKQGGVKESLTPVKESLTPSVKESLTNNNNTNNNTNTSSQSSDVSERELNYQPVKEKPAGCPQTYWKNKKREAIGKKPTYSNNPLLEDIKYFREKAFDFQNVDFQTLKNPSGKMLRGFKNVGKYAEIREVINWWLDTGGEYADYTPDAFISESTVNKYEAKNNKKLKKRFA